MIADCIALYDHWMDEKTGEDAQEMADERRSVELALQNMDALGLTGGTIYIDGKLCAFRLVSACIRKMQLIKYEKGDTEYDGIFPIINEQYALMNVRMWNCPNREEDMGIEIIGKTFL